MAGEEAERMEEDPQAEPPPSDAKAPMKFSFTVAKSSSAARPPLFPKADRPKEAADVEFVSEFDGKGRNLTASVKVIPLPEKSWRPEKRMKNIMVASENLPTTEERFESETLAAGPQPSVQYGLQLRKPTEETLESSEAVQDRDLQRLREDLALLPDEASLDAYDDVPVEEFGKALLRGMGWESGKPIGRNSTTVAVPIEPTRRVGREGLGAIPAPQSEKVKKYIKPGESRKTKLTIGRIMCVITGPHTGSRGQIAEVNGSSYTVALMESGKRVQVNEGELAEVGSSEEERAMKKLSGLHIERDNNFEKDMYQQVHSTDNGRKKDHTNDGGSKKDGRSSGEDLEAQHRERRNDRHRKDERSRSSREDDKHTYNGDDRHRKDERSRSSREDDKHTYNGDDNRKSNRRDPRDENRGHDKRGYQDAFDRRYENHRSRREEGKEVNDEEEHYEATANMQDRHSRGKESPSHAARDVQKSTYDNKHGRKDGGSRRADARGDSAEDYYQEKSGSSGRTKNVSVKGNSCEGPAVNTVKARVQSWLARDIRVRVIDKRAYGEKLYLQKACVVDVVSPSVCDIQMDDGGKIVQEVKQEHLETALPKRGGRVLVVGGKYRGQVGKLQERDSDKGVGLVQMEDNYEVLSIDLDNVAEFVGALHDMEQ